MIADWHTPVLLRETLALLDLSPGKTVVDCTAGGGGHAWAMLEQIMPGGFLVAIDQDPQAIETAEAHFRKKASEKAGGETSEPTVAGAAPKSYTFVRSNFSGIKNLLRGLGISAIDAALMDLGVSSYQLDEAARGFSYQQSGILDMRMDPSAQGPSAVDVVNGFSAEELEQILWRFGEERWSRRIARLIVKRRQKAQIQTTTQLAALISDAIPAKARETGPHPAKRSFQAIRIFVNRELDILGKSIADTVDVLAPKGRLAVISFHSLEDRLVKETMKELAAVCVCPKDLPVCVCGKQPQGKILTSKPIHPSSLETAKNPRSRSAKLRGFEKFGIKTD